jgi:hypothetical protein
MPPHSEKELVLGGGQASRLGLLLAPTLEPAEPRAQRKQPGVHIVCQLHSYHDSIVTR